MWYFTWILGVLLACAFGIINVLWLEAQEALDQHAAVLDPLTKLPNRVEFLQQLEQAIEKQKTAPNPFSLLMIGMDAFQSICDSLGDQCLEEMIITICRAIEHETRRQVDTPARYDAQTFAVILSGTSTTSAQATADRIRDAVVEQVNEPGKNSVISIGIAGYTETGEQSGTAMENLLRIADSALNQARHKGANQVYCT